MSKTYAGIGSRSTPPEILELMERTALALMAKGWTLRSGHAQGADQAFERGARGQSEVYLPWERFEADVTPTGQILKAPTIAAFAMASENHPSWFALKPTTQPLIARNCHQVFGRHLVDPVKYVICWTSDGAQHEDELTEASGGTGFAIRLADRSEIPVFNLQREDVRERIAAMSVPGGTIAAV